ncbi:MAG: hypothetical protein NTU89_02410 [Candidatus Dependentiae bacterium]|nr:hypothetical protein [Candidatus Dependentiae bacterium]
MKKQVFLLTLIGMLFSSNAFSTSSAKTTCSNSCNTTCAASTSCDNSCDGYHGKTFLSVTPHFQNASPELASMFNSNYLHDLSVEDKHGNFEVVVFGGKSTAGRRSAQYFLPYGHETLTFDGSIVNPLIFANNAAESVGEVQVPGVAGTDYFSGGSAVVAGTQPSISGLYLDPATYWMDSNKNSSKILPWNFGITYAALFEPRGSGTVFAPNTTASIGTGLISSPAFKSTIAPVYSYAHVGAGFALRYQFSDDKSGFYGCISTAVQNVRSKLCLNENVETDAVEMNATTSPALFGTANPSGEALGALNDFTTSLNATNQGLNTTVYDPNGVATSTPVPSLASAYLGSGFPNSTDAGNTVHGVEVATPPTTVAEAFAQDAWRYGKISGCNKITRLADIELSLGYQWFCGDCASTNWSLGVVIPTGNKPNACQLAQAVVGNGGHAGLFSGSVTEILLSDEEDYQASYRLDMDARYLFRNTQMRSFDLKNNEWSRYMMVWANKDAYTTALAAANVLSPATIAAQAAAVADLPAGNAIRTYTPGINVFTTDMYVKPGFQLRVNQALNIRGEHFRAELGWNILAKHKECVSLSCDWGAAPAFADSSYLGGVGLNNNRTIYNDAQTSCYNVVDSLTRVAVAQVAVATPAFTLTPTALMPINNLLLADTNYERFAIGEEQINLDSASSAPVLTQTPYATVGYAWECDYQPQFSIGGSYEFNPNNSAINQWLVWGKFEIAF